VQRQDGNGGKAAGGGTSSTLPSDVSSALGDAAKVVAEALAEGTKILIAVAVDPDELVLTYDPTYATSGYLKWFRDQIQAKAESWGFTFDPAAVSLKSFNFHSGAVSVVMLKWRAAWGTRPTETFIPFSMAPIDAVLVLQAVHALAGWSKVPSGDQGILDNMLGGETNLLSQKARDHLRGMWKTLTKKSDAEQAKALRGIITAKESLPDVANDAVTTPQVAYTLAGPTEEKGFAFDGKTADAEKWLVTFGDGVSFPIYAPKSPTPGYHNHSARDAADAAAFLPKPSRSKIKRIALNPITNPQDPYWATQYKRPNFHSYMTAGADGVLTIYPDKAATKLPDQSSIATSMAHETGHTWSLKTWGEDTTKGKWIEWKKAMVADRVSVSGYAKADISEDAAETLKVYVMTQDSPSNDEYRQIVPHRFEMLDREYQ
jgi:hypothetical protein